MRSPSLFSFSVREVLENQKKKQQQKNKEKKERGTVPLEKLCGELLREKKNPRTNLPWKRNVPGYVECTTQQKKWNKKKQLTRAELDCEIKQIERLGNGELFGFDTKLKKKQFLFYFKLNVGYSESSIKVNVDSMKVETQ